MELSPKGRMRYINLSKWPEALWTEGTAPARADPRTRETMDNVGGCQPLPGGLAESWGPHGVPGHQAKSACQPHSWLSGPIPRVSGRVQVPKSTHCTFPRENLFPLPQTQSSLASMPLPFLLAAHPSTGDPRVCVWCLWQGLELSSSMWSTLGALLLPSSPSSLSRTCVLSFSIILLTLKKQQCG